jgi:hypothetical protein
VVSHIVLHDGYELPGAVIYVVGPAKSKVQYILDIILQVLDHKIVASQESQTGICCLAERQSGQTLDRAYKTIGIRGISSQPVIGMCLVIGIPRAVIKLFHGNGRPCCKGVGASHQYSAIDGGTLIFHRFH